MFKYHSHKQSLHIKNGQNINWKLITSTSIHDYGSRPNIILKNICDLKKCDTVLLISVKIFSYTQGLKNFHSTLPLDKQLSNLAYPEKVLVSIAYNLIGRWVLAHQASENEKLLDGKSTCPR